MSSDSLFRVACYALNLVIGLVSLVLVAKIAGPAQVGLYSAALLTVQPVADFFQSGIPWNGYAGCPVKLGKTATANTAFAAAATVFLGACWYFSANRATGMLLSGTIMLSAVDGYQTGVLLRGLRFKRIAAAGTASLAINLVASLSLLHFMPGASAMAAGLFLGALAKIWLNGIRPLPKPADASEPLCLRDLGSCWLLSATKMLGNVFRNVPAWAVCATLTPDKLGVFSRAQRIAEIPGTLFNVGKGGMIAPLMAKACREGGSPRDLFIQGLRESAISSGITAVPMMVGIVLLERLVLGPEWSGLATCGILMALATAPRSMFKVTEDYCRQRGSQFYTALLNLVFIPFSYAVYIAAVHGGTGLVGLALAYVGVSFAILILRSRQIAMLDGEPLAPGCIGFLRLLGPAALGSILAQVVAAAALILLI